MDLSPLPECFYRVSVKALILDDTRTKFLVVQERSKKWELPGGGLDWGESPQVGLAREIYEEMGLQVMSVAPHPSYFLTGQFTSKAGRKERWFVNVLYETVVKDLDITPSDECIATAFVTPQEALGLPAFNNVLTLAELFDYKKHVV